MRKEQEIKEMYEFYGFFNDGQFANKDYRKGVMDALSFTLYPGIGSLERTKRLVEEMVLENYKIKQGLDNVKRGKVLSTNDLKNKIYK